MASCSARGARTSASSVTAWGRAARCCASGGSRRSAAISSGVAPRSKMLPLGGPPPCGGYLEARARTLVNQDYYAGGGEHRQYPPGQPPPYPYHPYYDVSLTYSRPWGAVTVGAQATAGRDVDGDTFSRFAAFVRYGGVARSRADDAGDGADDDGQSNSAGAHGAEWFVDAGVNANQVRTDPGPNQITNIDPITTSAVGFG